MVFLRPSKVFGSVRQLRQYVETRISELATLSNQFHNSSNLATTTTTTTATQPWKKKLLQAQQQSTDKHRSLARKGYVQPQAALVHTVGRSISKDTQHTYEKYLLKNLQEHFTVFKTFSAPNLYQHAASAIIRRPQRTMLSSTTSSPFVNGLFGRNNVATSLGMMGRYGPAAARQFSSTAVRSPCMTSLSCINAAATGQQPGILGCVASRVFSPVVESNKSTMTQKQGDTKNRNHANFSKADGTIASKDQQPFEKPTILPEPIISNAGYKVMTVSAESNNEEDNEATNKEDAFVTSGASISKQEVKCDSIDLLHTHNSSFNELLIHNNEISPSIIAAAYKPNKKSRAHSDKTSDLNRRSKLHEFRTDSKQDGERRKKTNLYMTDDSYITLSKVFYIVINLDPQQFYDVNSDMLNGDIDISSSGLRKRRWQTQRLVPSFIDSIEAMAYSYQVHISYVLKLLDNLFQHAAASSNLNGSEAGNVYHHQFRVVRRNSGKELRIYFPAENLQEPQFFCSKKDVLEYLCSIKAVDVSVYERLKYFSIVAEDRQFEETAHSTATGKADTLEHEESTQGDDCFPVKSAPALPDTVVGPDYFRQLQMFLDQTDYLIDTSPAFKSTTSVA